MSNSSIGKERERELVSELRGVGLIAERVPRSVADAMMGPIDDVIVAPDGFPVADHDDRPITRRLQIIEEPERYMGLVGRISCVEVKYTSSGAYGIQGLLNTHLETVGLGWPSAVCWARHEPRIYTGGLAAFATALEYGAHAAEHWLYEAESLAQSTTGLIECHDSAAIRCPRKPWVFVWREGIGEG